MELTHIESPDIKSVGYKAGILYVEFRVGNFCAYYEVQTHVFQNFVCSANPDAFFIEHIRTGYRSKPLIESPFKRKVTHA